MQIDALPVAPQEIEDLYPLSPMQQGMLFHALHAPDAGHYVNQLCVTVEGLEPKRLEQSWGCITRRHAILRTSFVWEGDFPHPLQIVHEAVKPRFEELHWQGHTLDGSELETFAVAERARGFDLTQAPLQQLTLVHLPVAHIISSGHTIICCWTAGARRGCWKSSSRTIWAKSSGR